MITRRLVFLLISALVINGSCTEKEYSVDNFAGFAQGTTYSIVYVNNKKINAQELKQKVEKILHDFDMSLSLYKDSSILSRINRNEDVKPDSYFTSVFAKSANSYL
jgi:thiamine biosynthesis lipoprotein